MANLMSSYGHRVSVHTFDDKKGDPLWPLSKNVELYHHGEDATTTTESEVVKRLKELEPDIIVGLHITREFARYVFYAECLWIPIVLSEHHDPYVPLKLGLNTQRERCEIFAKADTIHLINKDFFKTLPRSLREKATVVPNTISEPGCFDPARRSSTQTPTILSIARLTPMKNTVNLIRSFAKIHDRFPEWELTIAGYGELLPFLKSEAESRGIGGKVNFPGRVSETGPLYKAADIFVIPSLREGFPLASLEAMSHGLPIVGYKRCPGLYQQVLHGKNGYLCWGGKLLGGLPNRLRVLMADKELRHSMGEESAKRFEEYFATEKIGRRWEQMILETYQRRQ